MTSATDWIEWDYWHSRNTMQDMYTSPLTVKPSHQSLALQSNMQVEYKCLYGQNSLGVRIDRPTCLNSKDDIWCSSVSSFKSHRPLIESNECTGNAELRCKICTRRLWRLNSHISAWPCSQIQESNPHASTELIACKHLQVNARSIYRNQSSGMFDQQGWYLMQFCKWL